MYIHQMLINFLIPVIIQTDLPTNGNPRIQSPIVKLFFKVTNAVERIFCDNTNTIILQNDEHLTLNNNPEILGREKNFNYLSKKWFYLLAIALITADFFNGGLKRKPFCLFMGTLLLSKIPNHYMYNRKYTKNYSQPLIHNIGLVILFYSAALVKPQHVYLIKRAASLHGAAYLISHRIQHYLSSPESTQPVEEDPEVLTQSEKILHARSWLTKHLIWAATPSHFMGLSATRSTTETTETEKIKVELEDQNLDSLFSSGITETSKSFPIFFLRQIPAFAFLLELRKPKEPLIIPTEFMIHQPHMAPILSQEGETTLTFLEKLYNLFMGTNKDVLQDQYKNFIEFLCLRHEELSSLSSFLSISEIYGFMDSLDKDTIPESNRFDQMWTEGPSGALLMDHALSRYLLPEGLETTLRNLEINEARSIAELFNRAESFIQSLEAYSERERYIGVNSVFKKLMENLSHVPYEGQMELNRNLSRFLNKIENSLPFLSYLHTLRMISNDNLHFITSRAVNLKFLNIEKPFDFPSPEVPEGMDEKERYQLKTQHKTDWLKTLTEQIDHLEVLALDDELPDKGGLVAKAHQDLIAFDSRRLHAN